MLEQEERIPVAGHSIEVADPPAGYRHLPDLGIVALDCVDVRRLHAFPPPNDMSEPVRALKTPGGHLLSKVASLSPSRTSPHGFGRFAQQETLCAPPCYLSSLRRRRLLLADSPVMPEAVFGSKDRIAGTTEHVLTGDDSLS